MDSFSKDLFSYLIAKKADLSESQKKQALDMGLDIGKASVSMSSSSTTSGGLSGSVMPQMLLAEIGIDLDNLKDKAHHNLLLFF